MTSLPSWAVPGRKVVCVDDSGPWINEKICKGTVYTVTRVFFQTIDSTWCFDLKGESRKESSLVIGKHVGYGVRRFRPVVGLEDDMLTFRSLLNTVPATNHSEELTQ